MVEGSFLNITDVTDAISLVLFQGIIHLLESIPTNLLGFAADNASVVTGKRMGIEIRLKEMNKHLYVVGCVCHSFNMKHVKSFRVLPKWLPNEGECAQSYATSGSGRETATIFACVQADRSKLTPMILHKGKRLWDSRFGSEQSYPGIKLIEKAVEMNIVILKLPPHTSHLLQPLDFSVSRGVKSKRDEMLIEEIARVPSKDMGLRRNLNLASTESVTFTSQETTHVESTSELLPSTSGSILITPTTPENKTTNQETSELAILNKIPTDEELELQQVDVAKLKQGTFVLIEFTGRHTNSRKYRYVCIVQRPPDTENEEFCDKLSVMSLQWHQDILDSWNAVSKMKNAICGEMFHCLKKFAKAMLCLPHSSAATERTFSATTANKNKLRNRLLTPMMNRLLLTKAKLKHSNAIDFHMSQRASCFSKGSKRGNLNQCDRFSSVVSSRRFPFSHRRNLFPTRVDTYGVENNPTDDSANTSLFLAEAGHMQYAATDTTLTLMNMGFL
ncbi:hypothetical protein PR048_011305 [Dryococelus australis]|uniref:HAT C-terminal dimerisation domain-containing protein n=1 Tax=Dryococelus australis TaxID=614101 RepID=A0ABQ9HL76_9NEOP|nr:hypothetical protein PR048_011305 [Dryococelus australis]